MLDVIKKNPKAKTVHCGSRVADHETEQELLTWIKGLRSRSFSVSTRQVIEKALSINENFHEGNWKALWKWIYKFLDRHGLTIRRVTRKGQISCGKLEEVKQRVVASINSRFKFGDLCDVDDSMFVNMDETAIYYESKQATTINNKGENTVAIRSTGSSSKRMTVCVACAYDGTKLPLFLVFKGKPDGRIEKNIQNELNEGIFACCQENAWMDERASKIWIDKIWMPYVCGKGKGFLLLDEFRCHKQESFVNKINELGTEVSFIPGGYTGVLQPCDVGINKPLKNYFTRKFATWSIKKYREAERGEKIKSPERKDVADWINTAWKEVSSETIKSTYRHIGFNTKYTQEDEIVLGVEGLRLV